MHEQLDMKEADGYGYFVYTVYMHCAATIDYYAWLISGLAVGTFNQIYWLRNLCNAERRNQEWMKLQMQVEVILNEHWTKLMK